MATPEKEILTYVSQQEMQLIAFLRQCRDHDELEIKVNRDLSTTNKGGLLWTILRSQRERLVIQIPPPRPAGERSGS